MDTAEHPTLSVALESEITLKGAVLGVALHPNGTEALTACLDGGIYRVDLSSKQITPLGHHQSYASSVVVVEDGQTAISAGYDGLLQWHDLISHRTTSVVQAHSFWSWQLKASPDQTHVATVSGQYRCGGYRYEPASQEEPTVKVYRVDSRALVHAFMMKPPVLSVAFSPDGRHLAAGNMMGEIRIWDLETGQLHRSWETPDFTSWGIIKSHHYIGGIFDMTFSPKNGDLLACGMGPMRDPMAGNGKQTWQRFDWKAEQPQKSGEIADGERGRGLMETLVYHPSEDYFCMAGRMAQGSWNTALFQGQDGRLLHGLDTKMRTTHAAFSGDGKRLILSGATGQGGKKEGQWTPFGRLMIYTIT